MKSLKEIQIAFNALSCLTKEEITDLYSQCYNEEDEILCVDCYHPEDEEKILYTWYIPMGLGGISILNRIKVGCVILCESTVTETGTTEVITVAKPYYKTKEMHISEVHPYCKVESVMADGICKFQLSDEKGEEYTLITLDFMEAMIGEIISCHKGGICPSAFSTYSTWVVYK
jgi:hypothetical protein